MKYAKIIFLLAGFLLLALVLRATNLSEIVSQARHIGPFGILLVLMIYTMFFGTDVVSWQIVLHAVSPRAIWSGGLFSITTRLYAVRMIGEAYNNITPMGSMGGEPIKAWLLKHNYGIPLRDSGASLVLVKTASMFSLVIFVAVGFFLAVYGGRLSETHKLIAVLGLAWLILIILLFFLVQHLKLSTFAATRLGRTRIGRRVAGMIAGMQDIDNKFELFYANKRPHLALAMVFAMASWVLGSVELYWILALTGHPVVWADAWIIEAAVQLVRTIAFLIPAGIGAQEGALFLSCGAILGTPSLGIAIALVRRCRDVIWIGLGLLLASAFSISPRTVSAQSRQTD